MSPGSKLGPYEVLDRIGAGGMGEVYRARDTKLNRDVAVKVLTPAFAQDAERLARFQREAQVLAALNHPNIAQIYGMEGAALIMEYVPGSSPQGPLPVDDAMQIARQAAEALEYAHEKGIVHRDLKPGNIKVTPDGQVKILDFGLAKAMADAPEDISNSPTLSIAATRAGMILGTAAYMSPEQARGKPVDRRTDIWAYGCVLYELLTGQKAFVGETVTDITVAIMTKEPDWSALPAGSPVELLKHCLQKDLGRRLRNIGDASLIAFPAAAVAVAPAPAGRSAWLPWTIAGVFAIAAAVVTLRYVVFPKAAAPRQVSRFTLALPPLTQMDGFSVSPDGRRLVVAGTAGAAINKLFVRQLSGSELTAMPGTEGATEPNFSADGEWISYTVVGKLFKVSANGGAPIHLNDNLQGHGSAWGASDVIVSAGLTSVGGGAPQLGKMPSGGGALAPLGISTGEGGQLWPSLLPDGRGVLFSVHQFLGGGSAGASIALASLGPAGSKPEVQMLGNGAAPRYVSTGHILFVRGRQLMALPFDLRAMKATGAALPVADGIGIRALNGQTFFDVTRDGTLFYWSGEVDRAQNSLVWVDRAGKAQSLGAPPHDYWDTRASPDGKRIAALIREGDSEIWIYESGRGVLTRMTFDPAEDETPAWSPDGKWLVYTSSRKSVERLVFRRRSDGSGPEETIWTSNHHIHVQGFSPDGKSLLIVDRAPDTFDDVIALNFDAGGKATARPLLNSRFHETQARISPDGKWLAYVSDESGRPEVYVQGYPSLAGKWQVSTQGGTQPVWGPGSRELFYRSGKEVMAVSVTPGAAFLPAAPKALFADSYAEPLDTDHYYFDVSPDGRRFLMVKPLDRPKSIVQLDVVLNWFEELKTKGK